MKEAAPFFLKLYIVAKYCYLSSISKIDVSQIVVFN